MSLIFVVALVVVAGCLLSLWALGVLPTSNPPGRRLRPPAERSDAAEAWVQVAIAVGTALGIVLVPLLVVIL